VATAAIMSFGFMGLMRSDRVTALVRSRGGEAVTAAASAVRFWCLECEDTGRDASSAAFRPGL